MPRFTLLRDALLDASTLRSDVKEGLQGVSATDIVLIADKLRPTIGDSADLDEASKEEFPEANRWDYVISVPDLKIFAGIEPHTAKDSEISTLIAKKKHAVEYLRKHLRDGYGVSRWYWVTHGKIAFSKMDKARRRLDQHGIKFAGRILRSFD